MMRPQMVIIMRNTLGAMALRSMLMDIAKGVEVVCYSSLEEFESAQHENVPHLFVSADVVFRSPGFFRELVRRTIVVTEGEAQSFVQSGFRTIDATASEQAVARQILSIHSAGHPAGHGAAAHVSGAGSREGVESALLSQREQDVLRLMVKGHINKEIAQLLNISLTTVIFHRNNISEKLQTRSIGRLTIYAVLNNIVSLSEI
ncbi:MAG: response regulator transcription factor [Alistipes sp.]|nr:response regulator transcription factor [Alistipes sp.]